MTGHYIRKRVWTADWAFALAGFAGALLFMGFLLFRMGLTRLDDFGSVIGLAAGLLALALVLAIHAIVMVWIAGRPGGGRALAALFLGLLVSIPFAVGAMLAFDNPDGNSAYTAGMVADGSTAPAGSTLMLGREFPATGREVYSTARQVADDLGWQVDTVESSALPQPAAGDLGVEGTVRIARPTLRSTVDSAAAYDRFAEIDAQDYTINAVASAPLVGLPSDITIRIQEDGGSTFVDARSVSRDVPRDLGQNRRFIAAFLDRLESAMEMAQSGVVEE